MKPAQGIGRVLVFRSAALNDFASLQCEGRDLNLVEGSTKSSLLDGLNFEASPEKIVSDCVEPIEQQHPSDSPVSTEAQPAKRNRSTSRQFS